MVEDYWNPLVPELTVSNIEESLRFYKAVGFSIRFSRNNPDFAYIELGQAQLMLEQEHDTTWRTDVLERPLGRGVNFQIEVPDIQSVSNSLSAAGFTFFSNPKESWYEIAPDREEGQFEFLVQDPDGYLMRFTQYFGFRSK
ncbi:MAG: VOC family protein [Chloroflexi bacterium]|nr:VOC family protein [Chloroflexota bacterium]